MPVYLFEVKASGILIEAKTIIFLSDGISLTGMDSGMYVRL